MRFASVLLVVSLLLPTLAAVAVAPATFRLAPCCRMGSMDTACALRCARARAMGAPHLSDCPPPQLPLGSVAAPPAVLPSLAWTAAPVVAEPVTPLCLVAGPAPCREPAVPPPRA